MAAMVLFYYKVEKKNGRQSLGERTALWPLDLKVERKLNIFYWCIEETSYLVNFTKEKWIYVIVSSCLYVGDFQIDLC